MNNGRTDRKVWATLAGAIGADATLTEYGELPTKVGNATQELLEGNAGPAVSELLVTLAAGATKVIIMGFGGWLLGYRTKAGPNDGPSEPKL